MHPLRQFREWAPRPCDEGHLRTLARKRFFDLLGKLDDVCGREMSFAAGLAAGLRRGKYSCRKQDDADQKT